jgi:hypothetical protein
MDLLRVCGHQVAIRNKGFLELLIDVKKCPFVELGGGCERVNRCVQHEKRKVCLVSRTSRLKHT